MANVAVRSGIVGDYQWQRMRRKSEVVEHVIVLQLEGAIVSFSVLRSSGELVVDELTCNNIQLWCQRRPMRNLWHVLSVAS